MPIPASAQSFFGFLLPIVAFDLIPTDEFYDKYLNLPLSEPINQNFKALGYDSRYFIRNIGSIGIYFLLYPCVQILSFTIGKLCKCKRPQKLSRQLNGMLYWNRWFALVDDSYLILVVSIVLNLRLYSSDDF